MNRRKLIQGISLASLAAPSLVIAATSKSKKEELQRESVLPQSVMGWCFKGLPKEQFFKDCVAIGLKAIEGIAVDDYPLAKKAGLSISLVKAHHFTDGPTDPKNHAMVEKGIIDAIDLAKKIGSPNVIIFSGFNVEGLTNKQMEDNCVNVWKKVAPYAEKQGVTLVLEQLNTRDVSHPMKGHPGYFASDIDHAARMIEAVGSPNVKLLFDIYHVSIMNGDIIRRVRQYIDIIGHVHTAGNPGRGPLGDDQEIYYPAIIKELITLGYKGYLAHEFLAPEHEPIKALEQAYEICC